VEFNFLLFERAMKNTKTITEIPEGINKLIPAVVKLAFESRKLIGNQSAAPKAN